MKSLTDVVKEIDFQSLADQATNLSTIRSSIVDSYIETDSLDFNKVKAIAFQVEHLDQTIDLILELLGVAHKNGIWFDAPKMDTGRDSE